MNIVVATDSNYLKYCSAMLLSLLDKNNPSSISVHLLSCNLSSDEIEYVHNLLTTKGAEFNVYKISDKSINIFPNGINTHISLATWARMYVGSLLPESVNKILYIDCDTIITDSLNNLWNIYLDDNTLFAAVEDLNSADVSFYDNIGIRCPQNGGKPYFNAGVMLINLNLWRTKNIEQKVFDILSDKNRKLLYADQDVLNIIGAEFNITYLPLRYNLMEGLLRYDIPMMRPEATENIDIEISSPVIVHFTYKIKPWSARSFHPYKKLFYRYFDQTQWANERPKMKLKDIVWRLAFIVAYILNIINRYRNKTISQLCN